jgi:hypothetical protein
VLRPPCIYCFVKQDDVPFGVGGISDELFEHRDLVQVPEQVYGLPEAIIGSRVTGFLDPVRDDMTSVGIFSRLDNVYTSVLTGHNSLGRKE